MTVTFAKFRKAFQFLNTFGMDFSRFHEDKFFLASFFTTFLLILIMMHGDLLPFKKKIEIVEPIYSEIKEIDKLMQHQRVAEFVYETEQPTILQEIGATNATEVDELIELILDRQREIIDKSLKNYKYHPSLPVDSYEDLQPVYKGKPVRNMIVTTWRSGSTFLGDMMLSHPASFYHYEPLLPYGIKRIREEPLASKAISDLKNLLNCNYTNMDHYFKFAEQHQYLLMHNFPVWEICTEFPHLCTKPEFLSAMCQLFPFQVIKTVRLRAALSETFLKSKSAQVLLLVRDPRGTMQSRHHRTWCPENPDCFDPKRLCADLTSDYRAATKLIKKYPKTFKVVRYEDISLDIYNQSVNLFDFFRLSYHPKVKDFLDTHTTEHRGGVSSTFRDSKTAPIHWRSDLNWEEVDYIQMVCKEALHLWGYKLAHDRFHLESFNPIGKFSFPPNS